MPSKQSSAAARSSVLHLGRGLKYSLALDTAESVHARLLAVTADTCKFQNRTPKKIPETESKLACVKKRRTLFPSATGGN